MMGSGTHGLESPFAIDLLRNWLGYRLTGTRSPLLAGFKLTHRCNLRCGACPFWRRSRAELSHEVVEETLQDLYRLGARVLILEGGEPLMWRDGDRCCEDVIRSAREIGYRRVCLTTNGTLPIETSADVVWVSFDGLRITHEKNRGPCWDRIVQNIAASGHRKVLAQVTISRANWTEIPALVRELSGLVQGITVQFFYPYPESDDLWLPWDERRYVLNQLRRLKQQGFPLLDSLRVFDDLASCRWRCHDWLIANAEPSAADAGRAEIRIGCYLKGRAGIDCRRCGFAAHAELSRAYDLSLGPLLAGQRVFRLL